MEGNGPRFLKVMRKKKNGFKLRGLDERVQIVKLGIENVEHTYPNVDLPNISNFMAFLSK